MTPIERGRMFRAQLNPDEWVVRMLYTDEAGRQTIRYISPTRMFERKGYLRALCLSREEVRSFVLDRISDVTLIAAHRIQMPVPVLAVPVQGAVATRDSGNEAGKTVDRKIVDRKMDPAQGMGSVLALVPAALVPVPADAALAPLVSSGLT